MYVMNVIRAFQELCSILIYNLKFFLFDEKKLKNYYFKNTAPEDIFHCKKFTILEVLAEFQLSSRRKGMICRVITITKALQLTTICIEIYLSEYYHPLFRFPFQFI